MSDIKSSPSVDIVKSATLPEQLAQVKQLALLNDNIDNIIDKYLPSPTKNGVDTSDDEDAHESTKNITKNVITKVAAQNVSISNDVIVNIK